MRGFWFELASSVYADSCTTSPLTFNLDLAENRKFNAYRTRPNSSPDNGFALARDTHQTESFAAVPSGRAGADRRDLPAPTAVVRSPRAALPPRMRIAQQFRPGRG